MIVTKISQRDGLPVYEISFALFVWPGHFLEIGWGGITPRLTNPIGRRVGRWLEQKAS